MARLNSYSITIRSLAIVIKTKGGRSDCTKNFETYKAHQKLKTKEKKFPTLPERIKKALRQSRVLIVICSPSAAQNHWVNEEILAFKALGREKKILAFIVDGEPNTDNTSETKLKGCLLRSLALQIKRLRPIIRRLVEPIATDARKGKDSKRNAF